MSLLQYLSQRLLLLGLVVSAGIFYIVYILYQWGLDDSTEYYLSQDMQWAVEMLANNQDLPSNTQFRQFYLTGSYSVNPYSVDPYSADSSSISSLKNSADQALKSQILPPKYSSILASKKEREFFYLEDDVAFQYGLNQVLADGRSLTLIHQFFIEDTAEGISLLEISMLSSSILISIMLLGSWIIYQRIALSMQSLLLAAQRKDIQNIVQEGSVKEEFIEVEKIITSLKHALEDLEDKNEQERLFIQTLSHELRTPMATVQVALELLNKKELNDNVREKLGIIFNSNQRMQCLSNDLLSLWTKSQDGHTDEKHQVIDLEEELQQVIDELDYAFHCKQRFVICKLNNESKPLRVLAVKSHVQLLLNNLCKNAIVHSDSLICISIQEQSIVMTNEKIQKEIDPLVAGSGIGLIIATRAAELLGWEIKVGETDLTYELFLLLNP